MDIATESDAASTLFLETDFTVHGSDKGRASFGWMPLDELWQKKLSSKKFRVHDCPPDGNCQFSSVELALKRGAEDILQRVGGGRLTSKKLRTLVASHVSTLSDADVEAILEQYRAEKDAGDFVGKWDPHKVRTRYQLVAQIKKPGFHFQGDNLTLSVLGTVLGVDIIVIHGRSRAVINLNNPKKPRHNIIILFYDASPDGMSGHYQTVGLAEPRGPKRRLERVKTVFNREQLPVEVARLIHRHDMLVAYTDAAMKASEKPTLRGIVKHVEDQNGAPLSAHERKQVLRILRTLAEHFTFLQHLRTPFH